MSTSRDQIFGNIRLGLKRGPLEGEALEKVKHRLAYHPSSTTPARSDLPQEQQVELFKSMATEAAAELIELDSSSQLPQAVAGFAKKESLKQLVSATADELMQLDWSETGDCKLLHREGKPGDIASLTGSFAGIAETGTLMLLSGPQSPTTLNFLADIHMVLLHESSIVGPYEAAWQKLREQGDSMPRTVNMITGPSRSADIEQKLQMGAHGPKRLVIFLAKD
ncbi:MAG: LUD domain-containing protein [Motiliproteus sp.]|nr:LUD domain-containing protein [Motiliproteus sp.]MCW9052260.1 LUD domain-containing protein [Motiliproteus sp.]